MNLILFDRSELDAPLMRSDPRAVHLLEVLHRRPGEWFDTGIVNGPRGKGRISSVSNLEISLAFEWETEAPDAAPITLVIGLPRPQTARDVLRDVSTMGVARLHFVVTDRGEPNYAQSRLWITDEWQRQLRRGAEQAFCTRVPDVTQGRSIADVLAGIAADGTRIALDNYEAAEPLSQSLIEAPVTVAIGSERGWSATERDLLRAHGFRLVHLGARVLRTETACIAALTLVRARLGLM